MAKEQKTKKELETILLGRCDAAGMQIHSVTVFSSKDYGWDATYFSAPAFMQTYLPKFDTIKQELRAVHELKDETAPKPR
jgi:hypothetical protein